MTNYLTSLILLLISLLATGCASLDRHDVADNKVGNISVGKVQKEIKVGMSAADVITILGSPNIVTKDARKQEVWVYDKFATNYAFSNSGGKVALTMWTIRPDDLVNRDGSLNRQSGASSLSQKTLTLIIKLTDDGLVDDFTYHASSF
jgi:outer membrane protein assembly factor BamE (lipoprotein component of BamABCDE complex)